MRRDNQLTSETPTTLHKHVKHMETTLDLAASYDTTLLQQVPIDAGARDTTISPKRDPYKLTKSENHGKEHPTTASQIKYSVPRGVVVSRCLRIAESFENWIGL